MKLLVLKMCFVDELELVFDEMVCFSYDFSGLGEITDLSMDVV